MVSGAFIGAVSGAVPAPARAAIAAALAITGLCIGLAESRGAVVWLPQRSCETPQRWMDRGWLPWSLRNGGALGTGAMTRIGFPLWFVVPTVCFVLGDPLVGAVVFGSYGFARGLGAVLIIVAARRRSFASVAEYSLSRFPAARRALGGTLAVISLAMLALVGL